MARGEPKGVEREAEVGRGREGGCSIGNRRIGREALGRAQAGFLAEQETCGQKSVTPLPCVLSIICGESQLAQEGRRLALFL